LRSTRETTERSSAEFQQKVTALLGQVESNVSDHLARLKNELEGNAAKVVADSSEALQTLSTTSEQAAQEKLRALTESTADWANQILQQKSGELTREFSNGLETYTRSYLETISKSLSEIPEKAAMHAKGRG